MISGIVAVLALSLAAAQGCEDSQEAYSLTNELRSRHSAEPLVFSGALWNGAKGWANELARGGCSLRHSTGAYGENLYAGWGTPSCSAAVQMFYDEQGNYIFDPQNPWTANRGRFSKIGHFTQLVWASSRQQACASATGSNGCVVIVCRYYPAGNWVSDEAFASNVFREGGRRASSSGSGGDEFTLATSVDSEGQTSTSRPSSRALPPSTRPVSSSPSASGPLPASSSTYTTSATGMICPKSATIRSYTQVPGKCVDHEYFCPALAKRGFCRKQWQCSNRNVNPRLLCPKSCGYCQSSRRRLLHTDSSPGTADTGINEG